MSNPITVTVAMAVRPDSIDAMLERIPGLLADMLSRPGVVAGRAIRIPADPTSLLFIDEFESIEASDAYFKWRAERGDLDRLGALLTGPPQVQVWPTVTRAG